MAGSGACGEYDLLIVQADTNWYVVVLEQSDRADQPRRPGDGELAESCRYILNWPRVD